MTSYAGLYKDVFYNSMLDLTNKDATGMLTYDIVLIHDSLVCFELSHV